VDQGAKLIRDGAPGVFTAKGDRDYATEVDFNVERTVRAFLHDRTPDIGFLGEEDGFGEGGRDLFWALDPVDGTVNFAHKVPLCAVSLGLMHQGTPVLGVIDLPYLGARYTAVQGNGAYRDDAPIHVNDTASLADAVVTIGDYAVGEDAERKNEARFALTEAL